MVCSATAIALPLGACTTSTPCRIAVSRSILSRPDPARPMTCKWVAFASSSSETRVLLPIMRTGQLPIIASKCRRGETEPHLDMCLRKFVTQQVYTLLSDGFRNQDA